MKSHAPKTLEKELMHSFPEYARLIPTLIGHDEGFRDIAEDWLLCKQMIEYLVNPSNSTSMLANYNETLQALETELITCMASKPIDNYT